MKAPLRPTFLAQALARATSRTFPSRRHAQRTARELDPTPRAKYPQSVRGVDLKLLVGGDHYPTVMDVVASARRSVWIATANLKELMIEDRRGLPRARSASRSRYRSVLALLSELAASGVELRLLHAAPPSRPFMRGFDREPRLVAGGLELRLCPRNHLKLVVVDGRLLYFGSANWTGAGLGAKQDRRRNFELGVITQDERLLDEVQALYDTIWRGEECGACALRDVCPMPLDEIERSQVGSPRTSPASKLLVRLRPR